MSLHYILDGYNILHKLPLPESGTLERQREILVRLLEERRPQGSDKNDVTIVFDGQPEHYGPGGMRGSIRWIFTDGESADEKIKKMVADARTTGHIVVVTDDRGIRLAIRSSGVKVLGVRDFLGLRRPAASPRGRAEAVPPQARELIDEELKRIWLGKKVMGNE